jgi:cytochrome c-type protein NapC
LIPKIIRKIKASSEIYHKLVGTIDTPEKFDAHRWTMANRVWDEMKATDSRECRTCHSFSNMDLSEQGRSARRRHARAEEKGETCIDCHKGIAHEEPDEPEELEE